MQDVRRGQREATPAPPEHLTRDPLDAVRALWAAYRTGGQRAMLALAGRRTRWRPAGPDGTALRGRKALRGSVFAAGSLEAEVRAEPTSFETVGEAVIVFGHLVIHRSGQTEHEPRHWVFRFRAGKLVSVEAYPDRASAHEGART